MTTTREPVSAKVANGTLSGGAVGVLTWALTYFIPAWHSGIPQPLQALLPAAVGAVGYFAGGYLSRHKATLSEVTAALKDARTVVSVAEPSYIRMPGPNPFVKDPPQSTTAPPVEKTSSAGGAHAD